MNKNNFLELITKKEIRKLDQIIYLNENSNIYRDKENAYIITQKSPDKYILLARWKLNK